MKKNKFKKYFYFIYYIKINSQKAQTQFEIQTNEFIKKITDLEFENSLLSQKNKLLEKKLESLTNKYNDLKKELFDIEEHINFCKDNQIQLVNYTQTGNINQNEINKENFNAFKNKIKILFEYDDNFIKTDSDIVVYNMIIDNITSLKNDNLSLRKTLEDLKSIIDKNNRNNYNNNNINLNIKNINNLESNLNNNNISPIGLEKHFNNNINNFGMDNDSFDIDNKEQNLNNNNIGYTYNIISGSEHNNNILQNYQNYDIDKRCMNSKMYLNNLMNNIDDLQKVFKTENFNYDLPKTNKNKYSSSLNKRRLYHKYI